MSCNCECNNCKHTTTTTTTIHTPTPCATPQSTTHSVRLYTLRCGSWVYAGQMTMNSTPTRGMRLLWEGKAYTIEQSTLIDSEPNTDKWEVMLIQAGPGYTTANPCMPCPPPTLPPLEPTPCTDRNPPNHNTPRPVEMGLGCGPQYQCTGYPS
ncbi:hypothetical protein [Microcoleus phage My-WqHQDG]|nr:hypothetical protein [Microcoleus phage My-WqHQDG]